MLFFCGNILRDWFCRTKKREKARLIIFFFFIKAKKCRLSFVDNRLPELIELQFLRKGKRHFEKLILCFKSDNRLKINTIKNQQLLKYSTDFYQIWCLGVFWSLNTNLQIFEIQNGGRHKARNNVLI